MEALDAVVEKHWTSHQVKKMVIPELPWNLQLLLNQPVSPDQNASRPAVFSHVTSASTYVTCSWVSFSFALGSIVLQTDVSLWTLLILIWRLSFSFSIFVLSFSFWLSLWIVFWFSLWTFWFALGLHTVYFHWNWTFSSTVCTQHHLLRPFCSARIVEQHHLTYLCICGWFIDLKL